ncbi:MAG: alpha/beta hydrolase-fold protein [Bacteroidota bacterium]
MSHSFLPKIKIISHEVESPPLGRERRIAVMLPHDYDQGRKRYPVLYLQDGQNLLQHRSPFGNWHVDQRMGKLAAEGKGGLIVVAIDHAEEERIREFSPPEVTKFGASYGRQYARFMAEELKPYVDQNFRTRPDRQNTAIGGSSMGGLISIYSGLIYPEVYGKMMVFSPSLWLTPKIYFQAIDFFNPFYTKIYLYAGGKESKTMVPNIQRLKAALERKGLNSSKIEFNMSIDPEGGHDENRWGEEFPKAVKWLFFDK